VSAASSEQAVLQHLTTLLVERGVDAVYQQWTDRDRTYRCVALNERGRRYNDDTVWYHPAGELFAGERLTHPLLVWGHRFEHRVPAQSIQVAAEVIAAQALARAADLHHGGDAR
jgi:hypothetical protein